MFEIIQAQPQETGSGCSALSIWTVQINMTVLFGNFSLGDLTIADGNNGAIDICGYYDENSANLVDTGYSGNFDILNFIWIAGAQSLFQSESGDLSF